MVLDGGLKDFYYPRIAERIQCLVSTRVERICICSCSNMFASPSETYCSVFWFSHTIPVYSLIYPKQSTNFNINN